MRHWLLALALAASPAVAAVPGDKLIAELDRYLSLASYSERLSHFFELECPSIGANEFVCTGHRVTVMMFPGGLCKVYTIGREFRFRRTGANRWTDYMTGEPFAEIYDLSRRGPLDWEIAFHAEWTREFKDDQEREMYSTYLAKLVTSSFVARQISQGISATMDCKRVQFVATP